VNIILVFFPSYLFLFSPFFFFNILLSVDIHIFEIYSAIYYRMRNPGKAECEFCFDEQENLANKEVK